MDGIFAGGDASSHFVVDLLLYPRVIDRRVEDFCSKTRDALKG